jgi:hypothetical protein
MWAAGKLHWTFVQQQLWFELELIREHKMVAMWMLFLPLSLYLHNTAHNYGESVCCFFFLFCFDRRNSNHFVSSRAKIAYLLMIEHQTYSQSTLFDYGYYWLAGSFSSDGYRDGSFAVGIVCAALTTLQPLMPQKWLIDPSHFSNKRFVPVLLCVIELKCIFLGE